MEKILIVDNYDSFTYNLVHLINKIKPDAEVTVVRNDKIDLNEAENYSRIVLSPGPGVPEEAGQLLTVIKKFGGRKPVFGVCLGQQAIAVAYGGKLKNLRKVFHGVATEMHRTDESSVLFAGLHERFTAGRYHSWVIDKSTLPEEFAITANDSDGEIMAIEDKTQKIYGVQFHPESIMTPDGQTIMSNFLNSPL